MYLSGTTNNDGLVQYVERETGRPYGSSGDELREIINGLNTSFDELMPILLLQADNIRWDDSNHTDAPTGTFNLVTTGNDYKFTEDDNSLDILNIVHVRVKDSATDTGFRTLKRVKANDPRVPEFLNIDTQTTGSPTEFLELGGRVYFDTICDTAITNGGEIQFGREQSYFTVTGTAGDATIDGSPYDKEAGFPKPFHTLLGDIYSQRWLETNKSRDSKIGLLRETIHRRKREFKNFIDSRHPSDLKLTMKPIKFR